MPDDLAEAALPQEAMPHLRYLRRLVSFLAVVMAGGILAIVALLWLRLAPAAPALPEGLALPGEARAAAVTLARDYTIIVTEAGEVLVYDAAGGLSQRFTPGADRLPAASPQQQ